MPPNLGWGHFLNLLGPPIECLGVSLCGQFVIIQCAPNGSARNKVECSMSVLNLPFTHVVLKQGKMADWAEEMVKNCTTMKSVWDIAVAVEKNW